MTNPIFLTPTCTFLNTESASPNELQDGDIVIMGASHGSPYAGTGDVPYDVETFSADAPEAIRIAANETSTGLDHFDFDLGGPLLADNKRRLIDSGDLKLSKTDGVKNRNAIRTATSAVLQNSGVPILLGGDDSVPIPFLEAFEAKGPIDILQIDAHIDWRDSIDGETKGYSSTMIRASENKFVRSITQIGMRGVGSAREQEVARARDWGANLITVRQVREMGVAGVVDLIPAGGNLVIQIDCDAFDTSVCPAVNAPTPGGFQFEELSQIVLSAIAARNTVGFSIVELVPALDHNKISANVAARITCNAVGAIART